MEAEVYLHSFLTSALDGGGWPSSRPGHVTILEECNYPLSRWLAGHQRLSGSLGEEKSVLDCPFCSPVAIPTELTRQIG